MDIAEFDRSIRVGDARVGWMPDKKALILNRSVGLYGATNTGKTTCLKHILNLIKDDVYSIHLYSNSALSSGDFEGVCPKRAIRTELTRENLMMLFKDQSNRSEAYRLAHTPKNLRDVLSGLRGSRRSMLDTKLQAMDRWKMECDSQVAGHPHLKKQNEQRKRDYEVGELRKLVKTHSMELLASWAGNDEDHVRRRKFIELLDINPRTVVIFDDCMEEIKKCNTILRIKGESQGNMVSKFWSQGRQHHITIILAVQDDSQIAAPIRKNTTFSMFTDATSAEHFASAGANNLSRTIKDTIVGASDVIYGDASPDLKWSKLVYFKDGDAKSKVMLFKAQPYINPRVGHDEYWALCNFLDKLEDKDEFSVYDNL
jgi:hypothetical protein